MIASSIILAALAIPAALASPSLRLRQVPGCNSGTPGEFNSAPNITFNALETSQVASGDDGIPLVAATISNAGDETLYVLATEASAGSGSGTVTDFSLESGVLAPIVPDEFSGSLNVQSGGILEFASGNVGQEVSAEYCGFANTDPSGGSIPQPLLALDGDTSDFALCESNDLNVVVFEATADNSGAYDFSTCVSVDILIFEY
ncbi:hypothetical protein CERSUDRAFT_115741 [Gelatoporia subvermispora B]|uniref:Uncharacterized protein n=1 Tax=Ceriporiopsis subvermispora (strain B) TaxID=914234 RepID=M2PI50_CERS8|nr:hypothetical protein CERSUDRAFT_115741 [Gelatoporia subvermispora B]